MNEAAIEERQDQVPSIEMLREKYKVYVFVGDRVSPSAITGPETFLKALEAANLPSLKGIIAGIYPQTGLTVEKDEQNKVVSILGFKLADLEFFHGDGTDSA